MSIVTVMVLVFVINLPCGFFRAQSPKLSKSWFLWVHLPIPFVIAIRILSGLGFKLYTFPIVISAYFFGQFTGGLIYKMLKPQKR